MAANERTPALVQRYLERALPDGTPVPRQVRVTQTGEMFMKPSGRPMRFTATERFAVDRVAFTWEARFPISRLVSMKVTDAYADGEGIMRVRVLGIPIQRQSGHEVAVGEAYRYLAELPWVPYAMSVNEELAWNQVDERLVDVSAQVRGDQVTVRLEFDESGDIVRCSADARPRGLGSPPARWGGDLSRYEPLGGIRMPTHGEVYWDLPEGRYVYWRGRIALAEIVDRPFAL